MKDLVLNSGLSAFTFVAILVVAYADGGMSQQPSATDSANIVVLEKTVVTASRPQ